MSRPESMSWQEFFSKKVKPHAEHLDAWDITILVSVYNRLKRGYPMDHPIVDIRFIKSDVEIEIGPITKEKLTERLDKLENLGIIRRLVGLC